MFIKALSCLMNVRNSLRQYKKKNMTLHKGIALWLMNELKINSLIYFYDIFFNDIVYFGCYIFI